MKEQSVFFISYLMTTAVFLILSLFALDGGRMVGALSVITAIFTVAFMICFMVMNITRLSSPFKGIMVAVFLIFLALLVA